MSANRTVTEILPERTIVWPWKRSLCVDIDGVVCEYNFPKIVKEHFGVNIDPESIYAYDLADVLGVAPAAINDMFEQQIYGKPNLVPGAVETMREWKSAGYRINIFSNRVKYMGEAGLAGWLIEYGIPFDYIDGGKDRYDVHIDDSPAKLMSTDSKLKLLFSQPWNKRCLNLTGKLERVYNWVEIKDKVV